MSAFAEATVGHGEDFAEMREVAVVCTLEVEDPFAGGLEEGGEALLDQCEGFGAPTGAGGSAASVFRMVVTESGNDMVFHIDSSGWVG